MNNNLKPLVSVVMITYKHEAFIAEAINGVLMQECDFDVELLIADDNSPNNTQNIVESFKEHKYFGRIKYTKHLQNKGMMGNFVWALKQTNGKYVALCEGDDYWTDSYKLQRQIEVLEHNKNLVASFHNTEERMFVNSVSSKLYLNNNSELKEFSLLEMLNHNIIPTSAMVFRTEYLPNEIFTNEYLKLDFGDWPLNLLLARNGAFNYLPYIMSVRRMNPDSVWGMQDPSVNIRKTVESLNALISYNWFDKEVNIKLERTIELLQSKNKTKGLMHYLLNKIINVLVKIKNKT